MNTAEKREIATGLFPDIPHAEYHRMDEYVSKGYLCRLGEVPAAAKVKQKETPAMRFGRALHVFVLEGEDAFWNQYVVIPDNAPKKPSKTQMNAKKPSTETLEAIAWWEDFNRNNSGEIISCEDVDLINCMKRSIDKHPLASRILNEGIPEQTALWIDPETGLPCKCRPDHTPANNKGVIPDLKKVSSADEKDFFNACLRMGYLIQGAFYLDGMTEVTGQAHDLFTLICVEDEDPFRVEVYTPSLALLDYGRDKYRELLRLEAKCRERGEWPHYKNAADTTMQRPDWLK